MKNSDIAARLNEIAALMEFAGEPFFKIKAYERAARSVEDSEVPARALLDDDKIRELPGVGVAIAKKIDEIDRTGTTKYLEELRAKFPPTILELLGVPGVGAKTAVALYTELAVTSLADLRRVVDDGTILKLPRLGPKSLENLKTALGRLAARTRRMRLGDAWPIAESIVSALTESGLARNVVAAGGMRRMEPTVGDIDIVCTSTTPEKALQFFSRLSLAERVTALGGTKATIWAAPGISVDLRVVPHEAFGNLLQHFTGNKNHNIKLREFALRQGKSISEYGITDTRSQKMLTFASEAEVYAALGLQYIAPEIRMGLDEIDLARDNALPELVELSDMRGDLHDHTDWSDGTRTIEEMARAAAQRGRQYLSISDHSVGRAVANGLTIDRLREQVRVVRGSATTYGTRLLCSSEVDIRSDGSLDYPADVLAELDIVVASIHSGMRAPAQKQTERLLHAIRNPYVNVIGHPTGVLIEERAGYEFDYDAVFAEAAKTGTAMEINANPARLDLSATLARRAAEFGCVLAVDTDAHGVDSLDFMLYGVGTARKAGLAKKQILNTRSVDDVLAFVKNKRAGT